jgi:copper chaperone CopZ
MSRRRGEFEHRTSIFEGAYRAWSHLGGLNPEDLEVKRASELDPLTNPIINDPRDANETNEAKDASEVLNSDGTKRRLYPYEPLPRSGLGHPYVQAILSPWLGPDADHDAIQLGLTTLRTWWQHRRKGESGSAIAALGTEKMKGVVEGYTRHFFNLAHCLVVNDKEQPPRSLFNKMKEMEKIRSKRNKKRTRDELDDLAVLAFSSSLSRRYNANETNGALQLPCNPADQSLAQLDRMHKAQRRQLAEFEGMQAQALGNLDGIAGLDSILPLKGQCVPGKIDLPAVVNAVSRQASHLAHCGGNGSTSQYKNSSSNEEYGDPNTTPVVFVSNNGEIQIAMEVDGITCSHCIKIVETVLKGCNGNKSPIQGLLDAAADRALKKVLIRIEKSSDAKRVAFEAARNLAMVGYTARAHEMSVVDGAADSKATLDLGALSTAFEVVATTDPQDVFDWSTPCTCPDSGVLRADCAR